MTTRINLTTTDVKQTRVALKVFDSVVEADGVTVVVSFTIRSREEFGEYQLVIANSVMPAVRRAIEIFPEGTVSCNSHCNHVRLVKLVGKLITNQLLNIINYFINSLRILDIPRPPSIIDIQNIGPHSATILWSEGFHGGSDQTIYYEISSDFLYRTWITVLMDTIEISETQYIRNTTVSNLVEETIYYIRLYSTNSQGRSEMTEISNFTTKGIAVFQLLFYKV